MIISGQFDFTNVRTVVKDQKIMFACALRGSQKNTQILIYDFIRKAWSLITGWSVQDFLLRNGTVYYMDNTTGNIYQTFTNNYSDNSNPYPVTMYTKRFDFGLAAMPKTVLPVFIQGYMQTPAEFYIDVLYNINGAFETQTFKINKDTPRLFISPSITDELGVPLMGATPSGWADLALIPDLRPFYCGLGVDVRKGFFNIQFKIYSKKAAYFAISIISPFIAEAKNFPAEIIIDANGTGTGFTGTVTSLQPGAVVITQGTFSLNFATPTGLINSSNQIYTTTNLPKAFINNGNWLFPVDYTITGPVAGVYTITLPYAPTTGSTLMYTY
jgi:hypothetical protein